MSNHGFIKFCRKNKDKILSAIGNAATNCPPKMNHEDYRFQISNLFCHALDKTFTLGGEGGTLRSVYHTGYDMIFADRDKISIKIQKKVFEREKKRGKGLTLPSKLIVKNCLGCAEHEDLDMDFLVALQRGDDNNNESLSIGFGVISKKSLERINYEREGDQIKIRIKNDQFDFFSQLFDICGSSSDKKSELNRIFSEGLAQTYDKILKVD